MKQMLEALESYYGYMEPLTTVFGGPRVPAEQSTTGKVEKAITAGRQAIEQAEKQEQGEPVALEAVYETIIDWDEGGGKRSRRDLARRIVDLYTNPQPATQDNAFEGLAKAVREFATEQRAIEAAHGIKE